MIFLYVKHVHTIIEKAQIVNICHGLDTNILKACETTLCVLLVLYDELIILIIVDSWCACALQSDSHCLF